MSTETLHIDISARFDAFSMYVRQDVPMQGITAVIGPSASGKTSLLRTISGLELPQSGRIVFNGESWFDSVARINVPAHRRGVGYVHQDGRLLPHLDVAANLDFAVKRATGTAQGISREELIDRLELGDLLSRRPARLSGGERQRVAIAQALLTRPRLLLMDEPVSALDQNRKRVVLSLLRQLPERYGLPIMFVSHSIGEVTRIADAAMVMGSGKIVDSGDPLEVLNAYMSGDPLGTERGVILEGEVRQIDPRLKLASINLDGADIHLPDLDGITTGERVRLIVSARDVAIATEATNATSIQNHLPSRVCDIVDIAESAFVDIRLSLSNGGDLYARITRASMEGLGLTVGQTVFAMVKSARLTV